MTYLPNHRGSIQSTKDRDLAFHRSRLHLAVKVLVEFVRSIEAVGSGHGRYSPAARLAALSSADLAEPYLADPPEAPEMGRRPKVRKPLWLLSVREEK